MTTAPEWHNPSTTTCCYWTKQQAADYLGVPTHTVDYLVRTGQLAYYLIAGKRRFRRSDLDDYAVKKRVSKATKALG